MLSARMQTEVLDAIIAPFLEFDAPVESLLTVTPDGITLHTTDKAREAIVEVAVADTAFDSYATDADAMEVGVKLSKIDKFLSIIDTQLVRINITTDKGFVTLATDTLSYTFAVIDPEEVVTVDDPFTVEQSAVATLPGENLNLPLKLAETAGSRIRLTIDSEQTSVSGVTDDKADTSCFEFGPAEIEQVRGSVSELPISLDYFAPIQQTIPANIPIELGLTNLKGVRLQYDIADGTATVTGLFARVVA